MNTKKRGSRSTIIFLACTLAVPTVAVMMGVFDGPVTLQAATPALVTGALLGARLGVEALPEFYLESLESAEVLTELANDLCNARQVMNLFDDSWDQKYVQGMPAH